MLECAPSWQLQSAPFLPKQKLRGPVLVFVNRALVKPPSGVAETQSPPKRGSRQRCPEALACFSVRLLLEFE